MNRELADVVRWRDPTGLVWSAMLTEFSGDGLHFSVQGNGRRVTDAEMEQAIKAHRGGAWMPTKQAEQLMEITALRDELGESLDPHVRQWVQRPAYAFYIKRVAQHRARFN